MTQGSLPAFNRPPEPPPPPDRPQPPRRAMVPEPRHLSIAEEMATAGTLVTFFSDAFPHEVLPCRRPRTSLTGWFRRRE